MPAYLAGVSFAWIHVDDASATILPEAKLSKQVNESFAGAQLSAASVSSDPRHRALPANISLFSATGFFKWNLCGYALMQHNRESPRRATVPWVSAPLTADPARDANGNPVARTVMFTCARLRAPRPRKGHAPCTILGGPHMVRYSISWQLVSPTTNHAVLVRSLALSTLPLTGQGRRHPHRAIIAFIRSSLYGWSGYALNHLIDLDESDVTSGDPEIARLRFGEAS